MESNSGGAIALFLVVVLLVVGYLGRDGIGYVASQAKKLFKLIF